MTDTSQPAFPATFDSSAFPSMLLGELRRHLSGMSMRQYYAASSPVSLVDANESLHQAAEASRFPRDPERAFPMEQILAEQVRLSFLYADMMIAQSGE